MGTNKMRAEFEAWFLREAKWYGNKDCLQWDGDEYEDGSVQLAWDGWQASRAAVALELPSESCVRLNEYTPYEAVQACKRAVEAQGLEVAP